MTLGSYNPSVLSTLCACACRCRLFSPPESNDWKMELGWNPRCIAVYRGIIRALWLFEYKKTRLSERHHLTARNAIRTVGWGISNSLSNKVLVMEMQDGRYRRTQTVYWCLLNCHCTQFVFQSSPITLYLTWPDRDSNPRSIVLRTRTVTITPPMQFRIMKPHRCCNC